MGAEAADGELEKVSAAAAAAIGRGDHDRLLGEAWHRGFLVGGGLAVVEEDEASDAGLLRLMMSSVSLTKLRERAFLTHG